MFAGNTSSSSDGRAHVRREIASLVRGAEDRQRVERRGVDVIRIARVQRGHRVGVEKIARVLLAFAVQHIERTQVIALPFRPRLRQPFRRRGAEALQHRARRRGVLLEPDRMRVRHGLAPVRHGERRIGLLRLAERLAACGYSKLCSSARPRRNGSCASGLPELANATVPTFF